MRFVALLITALAPWLAGMAQAQELPSRVGRIAYVDGQVSLFNDPDEGWQRASLNYPITSQNSVWTDSRSRAELRVSGIALRLDERTQLDVARLDDDQLDGFIAQGAVNLRVRYFENSHRLDLATPHARFRLYGVGRYAIAVDESRDETSFTVFAGSAALRGSGGDVQIRAGSTLRVMGGARPEFWFEQARSSDFDRWAQSRDERWRDDRARRYVSTYMTGYEDLDAHGEWRDEADFGVLWYPARVERDWAPYRYGRWDYVRPWGWTWIDDAPWGYAPFHYGRWVYVRDRWAWSPGTRVERPTWAPALVGWVGGGAGVSVNVSAGPSVGWYPLSPWDRYEPWYRASPTYVNRINIVVRDRPNRPEREQWRTWTRDRGATIVQREQFVSSRPVHQARVQVAPEAIQRLQPMTSAQALPAENEIRQRRAQIRAEPVAAPPAPQQQAQGQQREVREGREGRAIENRAARGAVPQFQRSQQAPAPAPANAQAAKGQQGPAPAAANAPNPAARGTAVPPPGQGGTPPGQGGVPPGIGAATPGQGATPPGQGGTPPGQTRSQQQEQLIRGREAMERQQREQQQQQERAAQEQKQSQQQQQQRAQQEQQQRDRAARDQQQQQDRAAREQQHTQQQQQQQKAQADQQQRERAAREQQNSQQQQQQRAQQEQVQQQQKAQAEQQQRERAAREQQQSQQQQQQRAQQEQAQKAQQEQQQRERAAREQQQQQERAARENAPRAREAKPAPPQPAPQAAQPPAAAPQPQAAKPAPPPDQGKGRGRRNDTEKDDEEEKGKGRGRDR
jgi:hypothetical protein